MRPTSFSPSTRRIASRYCTPGARRFFLARLVPRARLRRSRSPGLDQAAGGVELRDPGPLAHDDRRRAGAGSRARPRPAFAHKGITVQATDFSPAGLEQLRNVARSQGVEERMTTAVHNVREPLALPDASVDAVFAHMLLCMALSTAEIRALVGEVHRVPRPDGAFVYTVRQAGDDFYEHGGFAVHFFGRDLVDALADGWTLEEIHDFEEGDLPRRLCRVTQTLPL
ncbi:methyltransferase domain-containing protein [Streptomyces zaomyceticus]|uniref:methyltransferase domain-containing protein n=1 Tax=Streptomyces zaomyceticus TaxID=68286 RepID=UPI003F4CDD05